jgi:hypothetical protein
MPYKDPDKAREYRKGYWAKKSAEGYWPEYQKSHKPERNSQSRKAMLKRQYGMTPEDYEQMFDEQQGLCALCLRPETDTYPNGVVKRLCVDHDHETGRVRGLLCRACNVGMGLFGESAEMLRRAADHIDYHRSLGAVQG